MAEVRDAHLGDAVEGGAQGLLQGVVHPPPPQALLEAPLAVGHGEEVLTVSGDQQQAQVHLLLQVGDVGMEETAGIELREAYGSPGFTLSKRGRGADEVEEQMEVNGVKKLILLPHERHQLVPRQQNGEDQALGLGLLQAAADSVPDAGSQGQAAHGAHQEAGVVGHEVQQVVGDALGASQEPAQVIVLLLLEDVVELGPGQQAQDLVVDIEQLVGNLLL